MIKKYLLVIAFSLLCVSSFAATSGMGSSNVDAAGFSKLSESEKAEILKIVADKAATKGMFGSDKESTEDKVDRWVKIGSNIGVGLGAAAKCSSEAWRAGLWLMRHSLPTTVTAVAASPSWTKETLGVGVAAQPATARPRAAAVSFSTFMMIPFLLS
jgi:hypothetical protein